jgi:hypothetical protein
LLPGNSQASGVTGRRAPARRHAGKGGRSPNITEKPLCMPIRKYRGRYALVRSRPGERQPGTNAR